MEATTRALPAEWLGSVEISICPAHLLYEVRLIVLPNQGASYSLPLEQFPHLHAFAVDPVEEFRIGDYWATSLPPHKCLSFSADS